MPTHEYEPHFINNSIIFCEDWCNHTVYSTVYVNHDLFKTRGPIGPDSLI